MIKLISNKEIDLDKKYLKILKKINYMVSKYLFTKKIY